MFKKVTIGKKTYSVASNVMGVTLGLLDTYDGKVPTTFGPKDWIVVMALSIFWGEKLEGRESDFNVDDLLCLSVEEGTKVMTDFQAIYMEQNASAQTAAESKKKVSQPKK